VAAGTARGGRGHLARKGERARAEENLRERSIEKVPGTRGRGAQRDGGCGGMGICWIGMEKEERGFRVFEAAWRQIRAIFIL
jgi:hypothetical protein